MKQKHFPGMWPRRLGVLAFATLALGLTLGAGAADLRFVDAAKGDIGAYELPPPRLSAFQQSSQLVLFWPLTESGFVLQQAVDPMRSVWKPGGTAPAGDDRWSVQVPFTNPGPVFRLRKR